MLLPIGDSPNPRSVPWITWTLIAVNVLVYVLGPRLAPAYGLFGPRVAGGEWWRLLTSGFIHAGLLHVAFNMVALYMFGSPLEQVVGRTRYLLIYLVALLAGSVGALIASPGALTVGASGAIFGLFGALLAAQRAAGIPLRAGGLLPVLVINLVFTLATPGVSIGGHVGGLLGGLAAGAVVFNRTLRGAGAQGRLTASLALVVLAAVLGAAGFMVAATRLP